MKAEDAARVAELEAALAAAEARLRAAEARISEARETAWQKFLSGPGGTGEALRQGRVDGLDMARSIVRTALTPPQPAP